MQDNSGMFDDFGFKLIVINSLLDKHPSFEADLERLKKEYVSKYKWYKDYKPIAEVVNFFENLQLTDDDLGKVTELCFDGGNDVYFLLQPDFDGEDDYFDVTSVGGFKNLHNLKKVIYVSMCRPEILEPLKEHGINIV